MFPLKSFAYCRFNSLVFDLFKGLSIHFVSSSFSILRHNIILTSIENFMLPAEPGAGVDLFIEEYWKELEESSFTERKTTQCSGYVPLPLEADEKEILEQELDEELFERELMPRFKDAMIKCAQGQRSPERIYEWVPKLMLNPKLEEVAKRRLLDLLPNPDVVRIKNTKKACRAQQIIIRKKKRSPRKSGKSIRPEKPASGHTLNWLERARLKNSLSHRTCAARERLLHRR